MKQFRRITLTLSVFTLLLLIERPVHAAKIVVNTTIDKLNEREIIPSDEPCSLREAIVAANEDRVVGGCIEGDDDVRDEIIFADSVTPGIFILNIKGREEDAARRGDLDIIGDVTITGRGAGQTVIDGGQIGRVFHILGPRNRTPIPSQATLLEVPPKVILSGLSIQNGNASLSSNESLFSLGGGIANNGELILDSCHIQNNTASYGGGLFNERLLIIASSSIDNNTAELAGGGIVSVSDNLLIKATTINDNKVNNTEDGIGGGIASSGLVELINSTVSGNRALRSGGIFHSQGKISITHTTIANNDAKTGGGLSIEGTAELRNSIVANNIGGDCEERITSIGSNLDSDGSCGLNQPGDLGSIDPLLGPLQNNGGSTLTHALLFKSPAINAVVGDCADLLGKPLLADQRGSERPQGELCDIGAYETKEQADLSLSMTSSPGEVFAGDSLTYSIIIRNTGPFDATDVSIIDTLPFGVIYQPVLSSPECVESEAGTITCDLGNVIAAPDDPTALQIVVSPSLRLSGQISNSAIVKTALIDPDLKNNSDATETQVIQLPPAATIEVNTTDDKLNDVDVISAGELCSLREAIIAANEDRPVGGCTTGEGKDEITFADEVTPGTFVLSITGQPGIDENLARSGDLDIYSDVTIQGNGSSQTIIDAAQIDRVLHIIDPVNNSSIDPASFNVIISGVSIQHGSPFSANSAATLGGGLANSSQLSVLVKNSIVLGNLASLGGGVYNDGLLTIDNSRINSNNGTFGAGLYNNSNLTVSTSTIDNNTADSDGGGVYNTGDELVLTSSTLSNNQALDLGGGITNFGHVEILNSTLSGNSATDGGGIFDGEGVMTITHTTIADNEAEVGGGVLISGSADLSHSIVADNAGGNCGSEITSLGGNLDSDDSCGLSVTEDISGIDPLLGPLQLNGGLTFTHALLQGSPAINAISSNCTEQFDSILATDQRGIKRPQPLGGDCDIGAYEARVFSADLSVSMVDNPDPVFDENSVMYSIMVENAGPDDANDVSVINTLPSNFNYQATLSSIECLQTTPGIITCNLGTVRTGDDALPVTVQIVATPSAGVSGRVTNRAEVSAIEGDSNTDNNIDTVDTEVVSIEANLSISKSISRINHKNINNVETEVELGSLLEYTLSITNHGPNDASGLIISDEYQRFIALNKEPLDVAVVTVEYIDMDPLISNCSEIEPGVKFSCTLESLSVDQTVAMTIGVKPLGAGALLNMTNIIANELDPEPENNSSSLSTQILPPRQLSSASRLIPTVFDFPDHPELAFIQLGSPLNLQLSQPTSVLQTFGAIARDDLWRLFRFNTDLGEYDTFIPENREFNFLPHRGFWLIVRNGNSLVLSGTPNDAKIPYIIPLQAGGQLISTPFNFPPEFLIDWNHCVAPLSPGIKLDLFDYEGESGGYVPKEFMQPMHAYWVFAETAMTLEVPPNCVTLVENEASLNRTRVARTRALDNSVKWRVKLSVKSGALTDSDNFIGADSTAIDAYDALDIPEPPAFHGLSLAFPHPEWNKPWAEYAADIRKIKSGKSTWNFTVNSDVSDSKINLQWSLSGICVDAFLLRDIDANHIVDMGKENGYDFYNTDKNRRNFKITADWHACL